MLIELNQIDMKYNKGQENEVHALKQVSFSVEQGDFVGLVGASGWAKRRCFKSSAECSDRRAAPISLTAWMSAQ